ncbi:MAG: GNAT family N-acetyltransferase [Deltaproteobacteria bacterium]|nr:GNAT family N-acetyltransferase [Deltaproteobacteria bacterium]
MSEVRIVRGYTPGAIGRVAELHGRYYHEHWGFGLFFEAKVATEVSEFLGRLDERKDGFWSATADGRPEGFIAIDGTSAPGSCAHLRWFIVSDPWRGKGIGRRLIDAAVTFCRKSAYRKIDLWTFEGLHAARYLYESTGFKLREEQRGARWGSEVNEQRWELILG